MCVCVCVLTLQADDVQFDKESLLATVQRVKPTVLLGLSLTNGVFNESVIKTMAAGVKDPM